MESFFPFAWWGDVLLNWRGCLPKFSMDKYGIIHPLLVFHSLIFLVKLIPLGMCVYSKCGIGVEKNSNSGQLSSKEYAFRVFEGIWFLLKSTIYIHCWPTT